MVSDRQEESDISDVKEFWTKNPMTYGSSRRISPDDICMQASEGMRRRAWYGQGEGKPVLSNLIDYTFFKGKNVLEIGHGVGWLAKEFISIEANYTGIDLSTYHHNLCKKYFSSFDNARFILGNAENLPFEDNSFDYIVTWGVLHHSPDTQRCIDEAHRVLKKGCTLFLMLYRRNFLKYWYNKFFRFGILRGEIIKYRSAHRVVERHTDTHGDGTGAPISHHYIVSDIPVLFNRFDSYKYQIIGDYGELNGFPSTRFNVGRFMSEGMKQRLLRRYGGYLLIWGKK